MQEMQETWVQSLVQEDPLEKGMATHFSILVWEIPWAEEPSRQHSTGLQSLMTATEHKHTPRTPGREWKADREGLDPERVHHCCGFRWMVADQCHWGWGQLWSWPRGYPSLGRTRSSSHRLLIHPDLRACCRGSEVRCPETSLPVWGRAGMSKRLQQGVLGPGTW